MLSVWVSFFFENSDNNKNIFNDLIALLSHTLSSNSIDIVVKINAIFAAQYLNNLNVGNIFDHETRPILLTFIGSLCKFLNGTFEIFYLQETSFQIIEEIIRLFSHYVHC
jgi:hypothetical protein